MKTGPIPVSCSSANTCPTSCPFMNNGCYAETGPMSIHWRKVSSGERGMEWSDFCNEVSKLPNDTFWRHNSCGDLPGENENICYQKLWELINANYDGPQKGFTYTHKPLTDRNEAMIRASNLHGFTINVSCHSVARAARLIDLGIPAIAITKDDSLDGGHLGGHDIRLCDNYKSGLTCLDCQRCQDSTRDYIIIIPVHGCRKKIAAERVRD